LYNKGQVGEKIPIKKTMTHGEYKKILGETSNPNSNSGTKKEEGNKDDLEQTYASNYNQTNINTQSKI